MAAKRNKKTLMQRLQSFLFAAAVMFMLVGVPAYGTYRWFKQQFMADDRRVAAIATTTLPQSTVQPFDEPLVSITFDDGWRSVYDEAFPIMERYGVKSTQYIISGTFENPAYMSVEQIRHMQQAGHEVAAHTVSHADLVTVDDEDLEAEVGQSKQTLTGHFGAVPNFATPLGSFDARVLDAVDNHYDSHRRADGDIRQTGADDLNYKETFDRYKIAAYTVRRSTTVDQIRQFIEAAKTRNAWAVLVYHQVDDTEGYYGVSPKEFEEQMKTIRSSGIKTPPLGDVLRSMKGATR